MRKNAGGREGERGVGRKWGVAAHEPQNSVVQQLLNSSLKFKVLLQLLATLLLSISSFTQFRDQRTVMIYDGRPMVSNAPIFRGPGL